MNIETANRLLEFRKANGYSQEELAEKIGVSRQAISKWERSESSPDTDNLIALAKLYGVTIDELLNGENIPLSPNENGNANPKEDFDESAEKTDTAADYAATAYGVGKMPNTENGSLKSLLSDDIKNIKNAVVSIDPMFHAAFPIVLVIVYLFFGFAFPRGWSIGWILFLLIPIIETAIIAFKAKNSLLFAYPVLVTAIFLTFGMLFYIWHPTWIIFLTIPLYYLLCISVRRTRRLSERGDD